MPSASAKMIRLVTLGRLEVEGVPPETSAAILARPKLLALLAVLGTSDGALSRDGLTAMFWPEADSGRARRSLNQLLYQLRKELGSETFRSRGNDHVQRVDERLTSDILEFKSAVSAGRWEEAIGLYGGPFLPGFAPRGTVELDDWLAAARSDARRLHVEAAWSAARAAAVRGDRSKAVELAARSADPDLGEEYLRRAITFLAELSDRAAALSLFERARVDYRERFDLDLSAETLALGERIHADARHLASIDLWVPEVKTEARTRKPRPSLILGAVVVLAWLATSPHGHAGGELESGDKVTVVLLPLTVADEASPASRALETTVASHLRSSGVEVLRSPDVVGSNTFFLRGNVLRIETISRIAIELTDSEGRVVSTSMVVESANLDHSVEHLGAQLAEFVRTRIAHELRERAWRRNSTEEVAVGLMEAAERDRIAGVQRRASGAKLPAAMLFDRADSLFQAAAKVDPDWAAPNVARARLRLDQMWLELPNPDSRAIAFTRVMQGIEFANVASAAEPLDLESLEILGTLLYWKWMLSDDDTGARTQIADEAERVLARVVQSERSRATSWSLLSALHFAKGDFEEAYYAAQQAYAEDAFTERRADVLARLFQTSFETGDDVAAQEWCRRISLESPNGFPAAVCTMQLAAWSLDTMHAQDLVLRLGSVLPAEDTPGFTYLLTLSAAVLARAGHEDSASAILRRVGTSRWPDPETQQVAASVLLLLGNADSAHVLLQQYWAGDSTARYGVTRSRRFAGLSSSEVRR